MLTRYSYGTAGLHRVAWRPARQRLLRIAYDVGFRAFDTAPLYGNGLAETELGAVLRAERPGLDITTKFGIPVDLYGAAHPFLFAGYRAAHMVLDRGYRAAFLRRDWSASAMRASVEGSLRRLRTDYLDRLCLHEPLAAFSDQDWAALIDMTVRLKSEGKIRAFGVAGEDASMAAIAARPGLDFVQTRFGGSFSDGGRGVTLYGLFGAFAKSGQTSFPAFLRDLSLPPQTDRLILSSKNPDAVRAYAPIFASAGR